MCGLVAQRGCIGAQFSGALQIDGPGIEHSRFRHAAIQMKQCLCIFNEVGNVGARVAVGIQKLAVLDLEIRNGLQELPQFWIWQTSYWLSAFNAAELLPVTLYATGRDHNPRFKNA
jgi:hypothetical protein